MLQPHLAPSPLQVTRHRRSLPQESYPCLLLGSALAQRPIKMNGPGALGDGQSRVGGTSACSGPALDRGASAGHPSLGWAHCPCTDAAAPLMGGAQLWAHPSGQGGGRSPLVASPRQDPASCRLRCTPPWEAVGTLASQPPPRASQPPALAVPEAQESGPGRAHKGLRIGQLARRCAPGLGSGLGPP